MPFIPSTFQAVTSSQYWRTTSSHLPGTPRYAGHRAQSSLAPSSGIRASDESTLESPQRKEVILYTCNTRDAKLRFDYGVQRESGEQVYICFPWHFYISFPVVLQRFHLNLRAIQARYSRDLLEGWLPLKLRVQKVSQKTFPLTCPLLYMRRHQIDSIEKGSQEDKPLLQAR